jgi:arginine:pyruvate transaminase
MKYASITERLADLGGAKWEIHLRARALRAEGRPVIELTIGEPDVPCPPELLDAVARADAGRAHGLFQRPRRTGVGAGTGRALFIPPGPDHRPGSGDVLSRHADDPVRGADRPRRAGREVLLGDPMYATYEGLVRSTGATLVPVPLRPERGFACRPPILPHASPTAHA